MLTDAQIAARKGKLTASRIACLMTSDPVKIDRLYREMIGEEVPEELSDVWAVRLGEVTESLNLAWFARKNNCQLSRYGEVINHAVYDWAACTLDAWCDALQCVVECKHVGGREPLEVIIDRYQPQIQWQMEVTGAEQCALSVIMGASEPVVEFIERDADYSLEMVLRGGHFMECVRERRPPVILPAVPPPVDASKIYDMAENERWKGAAQQWLQTHGAADTAKDCEKILKALVPADAKKCWGYQVQITRDRAGRLSLRELQL